MCYNPGQRVVSSDRLWVSSGNVRGWLGTMRSSAMTERVATAAMLSRGLTRDGGPFPFEPPIRDDGNKGVHRYYSLNDRNEA